jgi:hypothetical protein
MHAHTRSVCLCVPQSDLLWASLIKELYDKVEEHLGKEAVREHRASIALSNELPSDSPEVKQQKRRCSMRQRRVAASLSTACGLVAAVGLYLAFEQLLRGFLCPAASDAIGAVDDFCDCAGAGSNASEAAGGCLPPLLADSPLQLLGLLPAGLAALGPGLRYLYVHFKRVRPYLCRSQGDVLFEEAKKSSGRADMTESLGFMGKVKAEVGYLYDLLGTEKYHDEELGCKRPLRLCVMIDDLDRCPKESIVKVLEAVILLLVNAPITCWLAIDSRVVVAAIEDYFGVRRCVCAHSASKSPTHPPSHPSLRPQHIRSPPQCQCSRSDSPFGVRHCPLATVVPHDRPRYDALFDACVSQAVFLNSGISGFEFLDKIIQVPFCLPNLEERKKKAFLSKMVEAKELNPKRVLVRVEHELQEAGLYVPFYEPPKPTDSNNEDGSALRSNDRLQALVRMARGMREVKLLMDDPLRRAEMGISEEGLIKQIEKDGDAARDDRKESFLFMLSEEAKAQKSKRRNEAKSMRPTEPGNDGSDESGATAAAEVVGDRSASSQAEGSAVSEVVEVVESTRQVGFLLANESSLGRSNDQEAHCVLQWNGVVQAQLCEGVQSCADTLETGLVKGQLPGYQRWDGGVLAADGNIYGIPCDATQVLRFDPRTQQATLVGDQLPGGRFKWNGGVLAADGNIYGIPVNATQVLRLGMTLPERTAEVVLKLDAQSSEYARLESDVPAGTKAQSRSSGHSLRLPARGCGASVRLVAREGYELGMGQVAISVTIERKAAPAGSWSFSTGSWSFAGSVVLLTAEARYKIKLPEARFGIAENSSYAPMMDENERNCLERLCPFADGNPRRLKRIINVFNVGRRVVELRRGKNWSGLAAFKPKLLKLVVMLEQWPYRAPVRLK